MFQSSLSSLSNLIHLPAVCNSADSVLILPHPGRHLFGNSPFFFFFSLSPESCLLIPFFLVQITFSRPHFLFLSLQMKFLYLPSGVLQVPSPSADIPVSAICSKYSCYGFSVVSYFRHPAKARLLSLNSKTHVSYFCIIVFFLATFGTWICLFSSPHPPCLYACFMSYTLICKTCEMLYMLTPLQEKMTPPLTFLLGY